VTGAYHKTTEGGEGDVLRKTRSGHLKGTQRKSKGTPKGTKSHWLEKKIKGEKARGRARLGTECEKTAKKGKTLSGKAVKRE